MNYEKKYLKYKKKYASLKEQSLMMNGGRIIPNPIFSINNCAANDEIISCQVPILKIAPDISLWTITQKLSSQGSNGEIFLGHLNDPSNIKIIKYIKLQNIDLETAKKQISNEICIQNIAASLNIAPKIHDYWLCAATNTAVIVMDRVGNITLNRYFEDIKTSLDNQQIDDNIKLIQIYNLYFAYKLAIMKVLKLNHNYIIHCDFHLENILVTLDIPTGNITDVNIIDFGLSQRLNIVAVQTTSEMFKHNVNSRYIDSAIRLGHYSTLINKDYYVFLGNSTNSILQKIKLYKENLYVDKLTNYCNTLHINSIYYYYALVLMSEELDALKNNAYHNSIEELNTLLNDMYVSDIQFFIGILNDKLKKDIIYITNFRGVFQNNIQQIEAVFDRYLPDYEEDGGDEDDAYVERDEAEDPQDIRLNEIKRYIYESFQNTLSITIRT